MKGPKEFLKKLFEPKEILEKILNSKKYYEKKIVKKIPELGKQSEKFSNIISEAGKNL